jgi:hypothetical protein
MEVPEMGKHFFLFSSKIGHGLNGEIIGFGVPQFWKHRKWQIESQAAFNE